MDEAGGGIVGVAYNTLQDTEAFQALLDKPTDQIKPWEVVAISMMLDECIGESGVVDCEALQTFVNSCYSVTIENMGTGSWMGDPERVTVKFAPIMSLVSAYRIMRASQMAEQYENNDYRLTFHMNIEDVQGYCYVTDVIYALSIYGDYSAVLSPVQQCNGLERFKAPVSITSNSEGSIMTVVLCEDPDRTINIYQFTQNFYQEVLQADMDCALNGIRDENAELIINGLSFLVEQAVGLVPWLDQINTLYGFATGAYSLYDSYNQTVSNNEYCYWQANMDELNMVAGFAGCSGSVVQCGNTYTINNMALDMDDVVMQEYESYINGQASLEDCPALSNLIQFDSGSHLCPEGNKNHYYALVEQQLEATGVTNTDIEQNHINDIQAAAYDAAVQWLAGE